MTPRLQEIMVIAQEEAAEVIQEISKCFRFGIDNSHKSGITHREFLEQEVGDFLAMIDLLVEEGVLSEASLAEAKRKKTEKLHTWSNIFK